MEQAGIVEAGHDGHESVKSRAVFGHSSLARLAERGKADANRVREGGLRLAAGAGRNFPDGTQTYPVQSRSAAALPPGHFDLTKAGNHLRLEWMPDARRGVGTVIRETTMP